MSVIARFFAFWYDFIVGDDWTVAVGVLLALAVTAWLVGTGIAVWWVMPLAVTLLLALSLARAVRR
ncbi:MAG: hypothetical protein HZB53_19545 [Chloroflexi bacterium]|nr:hypothetical protein [Chloroflexota bacterium]